MVLFLKEKYFFKKQNYSGHREDHTTNYVLTKAYFSFKEREGRRGRNNKNDCSYKGTKLKEIEKNKKGKRTFQIIFTLLPIYSAA